MDLVKYREILSCSLGHRRSVLQTIGDSFPSPTFSLPGEQKKAHIVAWKTLNWCLIQNPTFILRFQANNLNHFYPKLCHS
jgi:hypothetical protein